MCVLFCVSRSACPSSTTSSPTQCLAGTYAPEGSTSCSTCDAGYQCPVNGMSTQDACTNGTYADSTSSTSCDPCPAGQLCHSFFLFSLLSCSKNQKICLPGKYWVKIFLSLFFPPLFSFSFFFSFFFFCSGFFSSSFFSFLFFFFLFTIYLCLISPVPQLIYG